MLKSIQTTSILIHIHEIIKLSQKKLINGTIKKINKNKK